MKWINVKDQMPECGKSVLISNGKYVKSGWRTDKKYNSKPERVADFKSSLGAERNVTHWMPLPEPPK